MRLSDLRGKSVAVWGTGREGRAAVTAIARYGPSRLLAVDDSANFLSVPWEGELAALYGRDQDCTDDLEVALFGDELCDEVKTALDRLGPEYRDVVERADLRGEKYKDIADALDVPIGTVMSRLFRARRVLEGELAGFAARDYGIKRAA